MTAELQHWHKKRKPFNFRQVGTLTGEIKNICSVTTWGKYIYLDIQHSVAVALDGISVSLKSFPSRYKKLEQCIKSKKVSSDDELKAHFAQSHATKMIWSKSKRLSMGAPIAFLIPRDLDFTADSDSSLIAVAGYLLQLKCWWHLELPKEVQDRNIREMKRDKKEKLISTNILECIT
eukprot:5407058-Ditylum_brightwellii.AAC.1